jgi:hypothetical protein
MLLHHVQGFIPEHWCESAIMFRKKVLAIPLVAASETGTAQTIRVYMDGVVGRSRHLVAEELQNVCIGKCAGKHDPRR